jgi:hypothetical protein
MTQPATYAQGREGLPCFTCSQVQLNVSEIWTHLTLDGVPQLSWAIHSYWMMH